MKKTSLKEVSTWRSVSACLCLGLTVMCGTGFVLNFLAPWDYTRSGLLYFRQAEAFSFFLFAFAILMLVNNWRPNWQLERIFFRLIISLAAISSLGVLVALASREFAQVFLIGFALFLFSWVFYGKFLREALICAALVITLLISPIDIIMSSPFHSTDGRQAAVQLLDAQYGLMRESIPGTYSMGCVVPPNPLAWVLWIDLWPLVDHAFRAFENFFQINTRLGNGP